MSSPGGAGEIIRGVRWTAVSSAAELQRAACQRILEAAQRAIAQRDRFLIVLAGGSTPRDVYQMLRTGTTDWSRWHVYFGDERCVPQGSADRNSSMANDAFLAQVPIPAGNVHPIPAELGAKAGASTYAETLRTVGDFDLVLLGLGEDGHTASLFPGKDCGSDSAIDVLPVFNAPKPPTERVTLSASRLSRTQMALFLVTGESKRAAVARWRRGESLPAAAIVPAGGVEVLVESVLVESVLI